MSNLSDIVLDDYQLLSDENLGRIVAEYKRQHPKLYEEWKTIEQSLLDQVGDPLQPISLSVHRFLWANCVVKTNYAVIRAFVRMRSKIGNREHLARRLH